MNIHVLTGVGPADDGRSWTELSENISNPEIVTFPARGRDGELVGEAVAETVGQPGGCGGGGPHGAGGGRHGVVQDERLEIKPQLTHISGVLLTSITNH